MSTGNKYDDEIERPGTHIRVNPSGHRELVIKRKGKPDDETLNELARDINNMLEGMDFSTAPASPPGGNFNQPDTPQMVGSRGDIERANGDSPNNMTLSLPQTADGPDVSKAKSKYSATARGSDLRDKYIASENGLDSGVTHSESFTGTAGIALTPVAFEIPQKRKKRKTEAGYNKLAGGTSKKDYDIEESNMSRAVINEWDPPFKAAGYTPGDHQMTSPTGNGVAARKPTTDSVGSYETSTKSHGKEWPRDHKDTPAMCDVDENGVENEPQGSHESTHGEPNDGHQKKVGHDWPAEPKNSGQGVAEPFDGERWSDGGTLKGGQAPNGLDVENDDHGLPSDGPITGTSSEGWTPSNIGKLMEGELDIQSLFNSYARQSGTVCLEEFQELCRAHGAGVKLDETSLLRLMDNNHELLFHEGRDASGAFWVGEELSEEWKKPWLKDGESEESAEDESDESEESESEESAEDESETVEEGLVSEWNPHQRPGAGINPASANPIGRGAPQHGIGNLGMGEFEDDLDNASYDVGHSGCPECGFEDVGPDEEMCPECGAAMGGDTFGDIERGHAEPHGMYDESRAIVVGPKMVESLKRFMESAKSIFESPITNQSKNSSIAEALQLSWGYHAKNVDPREAPTNIRESLLNLMRRFRGFNPLRECNMGKEGGKPIGGSGSPTKSEHLSTEGNPGPDDMEDHGEPLGKAQTNDLEGTPVIKGTEKGMSGDSKSVKENVNRLAKHVQKNLQEAVRGLNKQKYGTSYTILVKEGKTLNRTAKRSQLAEALADLEELLQIHSHRDVCLEACIHQGGSVIRKFDIPAIAVKERGPLVSEGAALFRFKRIAESFADELVSAGATCRVQPHKWGTSVAAKVNYKAATRAFRNLNEAKQ